MGYGQLMLSVKRDQGDTFRDTYQLNLSLSYVYCLATSYHYSLREKTKPFQYALHSGRVVQAALWDWVVCLALIAFVINTLALRAISSDSTARIILRTMEMIICKIRWRCYAQVQTHSKVQVATVEHAKFPISNNSPHLQFHPHIYHSHPFVLSLEICKYMPWM
jgi:hypothetical protein